MDFSLTSDQLLIRDTVRQFMEDGVRPLIREYEREEKFPAEELRKLGELGCCGMLIPEEWGGAGTDTISYALMLEEVARVDASMAVTLSVTNSVVAWPVWKHGTRGAEEEISAAAGARRNPWRVLPHRAAGRLGCGGDSRRARCATAMHTSERHEKLGHERRRSGRCIVVFAKTDPAGGRARRHRVSGRAVVSRLSRGRYEDKMGLRLSRSAEIVFEDCRVPAENRLGEEGQGLKIALEVLDGGRVGIAAQAVGIAQGALEAAVRYAKQRRAFGKPIGDSRRFNGCSRTCRPKLKRRAV